ncbi:hypothetical protein PIB30_050440 [Stylosanthes scabra]|uniref:Uncharacterized protein n=1 Tax=Stylosanthes scabra TaxID=79078 RepID=A0ABU6RHU1_9FABA|nr:hypothetical protein [Stylosanthes scabra]
MEKVKQYFSRFHHNGATCPPSPAAAMINKFHAPLTSHLLSLSSSFPPKLWRLVRPPTTMTACPPAAGPLLQRAVSTLRSLIFFFRSLLSCFEVSLVQLCYISSSQSKHVILSSHQQNLTAGVTRILQS